MGMDQSKEHNHVQEEMHHTELLKYGVKYDRGSSCKCGRVQLIQNMRPGWIDVTILK